MTPRTDYGQCMLCEALCGLEVEYDGQTVTKTRGDAAHVLASPFAPGSSGPAGVPKRRLRRSSSIVAIKGLRSLVLFSNLAPSCRPAGAV